MGQYWKCYNLDKKEYIDPHRLGCGLKMWEQLANHPSTGTALIILLASYPEGRRCSGDLEENGIIGRWVGDRVVFIGDYAENTDFQSVAGLEAFDPSAIYGSDKYIDISNEVCAVIEKELGGKFTGDGWRRFKYNHEEK